MKFSEDFIQYVWQHALFKFLHLKTTTGQRVEIFNPGILNRNSGPDFEHAKIKIDNEVLYGHVEIHIEGRDWYAHKHEENEAYNGVVLHVCLKNGLEVKRQDNTLVPCIELENRMIEHVVNQHLTLSTSRSNVACSSSIHTISSYTISEWTTRMLVERYEKKLNPFLRFPELKNNINQLAFALILKAFSTPVNANAFIDIAIALPWKVLLTHRNRLDHLEALLIGTAGIIEGEDEYAKTLMESYTLMRKKYFLSPIASQIKKGKMRPWSQPTLRLAQLASVIFSQPYLIDQMLETGSIEESGRLLQTNLSPYWLTHYTFSNETKISEKRLSKDFAEKFISNAIVPLQLFYAKRKQSPSVEKFVDVLEKLKPEKNSITKIMEDSGFKNSNAADSQALLHLHKSYCSIKDCLKCNIGKTLLLQS